MRAHTTSLAALAAKRSADALPALERGYVFVSAEIGGWRDVVDPSKPGPYPPWRLIFFDCFSSYQTFGARLNPHSRDAPLGIGKFIADGRRLRRMSRQRFMRRP